MVNVAPKRTEKEYRMLNYDSYSTLKDFADDRRKYYKKYVLGEKSTDDDDDNKAILIGTIVETLKLEGEEEFDNKFYMSITDKNPTGNSLKFVNALYKKTLEATNTLGELEKTFLEISQEAYIEAGIQKPGFPKFMETFIGSDDETYYRQMRESRPMCKKIVSLQDIDNAKKIVKEMEENPLTSFIFNQETDSRYTVFNQLQVEGYELDGIFCKSMYDKIIADHKEKTIQFYDLKCTWNVEGFYRDYYLYRRSYIQAYLYHHALVKGYVDLGFDYEDYEILLPQFVVVDSINYMHPLIYQLDDDDMDDAYNGFKEGKYSYPGVKQIIEDLKWAKENDEWRISKENASNGGIVKFKKER